MWQAVVFLFWLGQGGEQHRQFQDFFVDGFINLGRVFAVNAA
jgi:hypothetical protein